MWLSDVRDARDYSNNHGDPAAGLREAAQLHALKNEKKNWKKQMQVKYFKQIPQSLSRDFTTSDALFSTW